MSKVSNTERVDIKDNTGKVGAENEVTVKGGIGKDSSLSNVSDIKVGGTNSGDIGADNKYDIKGGLAQHSSVGNTSNVTVGENKGKIGAGNKVNLS